MAKEEKEAKAQLRAAIEDSNVETLKEIVISSTRDRYRMYPAASTRRLLRSNLFKNCSLCAIFDSCIQNDVFDVEQAKKLLTTLKDKLDTSLENTKQYIGILEEVGLLLQYTKSLIEGLKKSSPFKDLIQTLEDIFKFTNQTIKNGFLIFTKENIGDKSLQESLLRKLKQARTPQQCSDAALTIQKVFRGHRVRAARENQADKEKRCRQFQLSKMVEIAESSRKQAFVAKAKSATISELQELVLDLYENPPIALTDDFKEALREKLYYLLPDDLCSIFDDSGYHEFLPSALDLIRGVGAAIHSLWKKTKKLIDSSDTSSFAVYELYLFLKWLELLGKHLVSCSQNVADGPRMFTKTLSEIYNFTTRNNAKGLLLFTFDIMGTSFVSNGKSFLDSIQSAKDYQTRFDQAGLGIQSSVTNRSGKIRLRKGKVGSGDRAEYENKVRAFRIACNKFLKSVCRPFIEGSAPGFLCTKPGVAPVIKSCFGYLDNVKKTSATKRWYKHAFKQATALDAYNKKKNTSQTSAVGSHTETTTLDKKQIKLWKSIWTTPFSMSGRATVKDPEFKDNFKILKSDKLMNLGSPCH